MRSESRFGWCHHELSDTLGVWPSVISRYWRNGASARDIERLRAWSRLSPTRPREVGRDDTSYAAHRSQPDDPFLVSNQKWVTP